MRQREKKKPRTESICNDLRIGSPNLIWWRSEKHFSSLIKATLSLAETRQSMQIKSTAEQTFSLWQQTSLFGLHLGSARPFFPAHAFTFPPLVVISFSSSAIICLHLFLPPHLLSRPVTAVCCHYSPALTTSQLLSVVSR